MTATIVLLYGYSLDFGGVERHLLALLRHGDGSRFRWLIAAPVSEEFSAKARAAGAAVAPWMPRHALDPMALWRLLRLLYACRAEIVHVHSPNAALLGGLAARLLRRQCVITVHLPAYALLSGEGLGPHLKRMLYQWAERLAQRGLAQVVIYVSERMHQDALMLGVAPPDRSRVIENGIEMEAYARAPALAGATPALVCVGRLELQKGLDLLLEAVAGLETPPEIRLIGDGSQVAALRAQARRLGLEQRIRFCGFQPHIADWIGEGDVFVLPSRYEGMSYALLEAMACGLPSVVTDAGDNARLVEHGVSGLVVPVGDVAALKLALQRMLSDPGLRRRMGQAARQKAQAYSAARMAARTQDVYRATLRAHARSGAS